MLVISVLGLLGSVASLAMVAIGQRRDNDVLTKSGQLLATLFAMLAGFLLGRIF